jgi:2-dehydro-3-deoxyphosphogluconate aldolase/(4S)-4-hydroxy-2-oxoglutarate aldolase
MVGTVMAQKEFCLRQIVETGVVAVVRVDSSDQLVDVVHAVAQGGVTCVEVTMTTPNALGVIADASARFGEEILIGVGSVLDAETARMAILAGAEFVVGPALNAAMIAMCRRYGKVVVPGAFTPTEIVEAWQGGADLVKVFPASLGGPALIKALKGPLPQIPLVPTGGVTAENTGEFIRAGAAAVAAGTSLVSKDLVKKKDFKGLTERARQFAEAVKQARE